MTVLAAAGAVGYLVTRDASQPASVHAPAFSLPDVRDPAQIVSLPPGRPAVVNFFASWCVPCKKEAPLLRKAADEHGAEIAFLGVDHLDQRDDALAFLDENGLTYPAGYDPGGDVAPRYRLPGLPATAFVRADGSLAAVVHGEIKPDVLATRLRELTLHARQG